MARSPVQALADERGIGDQLGHVAGPSWGVTPFQPHSRDPVDGIENFLDAIPGTIAAVQDHPFAAASRNIHSVISFDIPYGLVGLARVCSVTGECS